MSDLGCSTISFRHRSLPDALTSIASLGVVGIDLGGLPGVCDHVPTPLGPYAGHIAADVERSGLDTWAVNADPGPLNDPALGHPALVEVATGLVDLAARLGAALIVPCGAPSRVPFTDEVTDLNRVADRLRLLSYVAGASDVRLLVEGLHHHRFCHSAERAGALLELVPAEVAGFVFDVSHVVAGEIDEVALAAEFAHRIEHVHLRDAVPGEINLSVGRGRADFAGVVRELDARGYTGRYVLELETHDVTEDDRDEVAAQSRDVVSALLAA